MHRSLQLAGCVLAACIAAPSMAAVRADEVPRISNGSTGFIGLTASAGMATSSVDRPATRSAALPAGEASTVVQGQPNRDPAAVAITSGVAGTRAMGNSGAVPMQQPVTAQRKSPVWGTPD